MRILVTGGAGFVGSHVVDRLVRDGHAVAVVDNLSSGRRAHVHREASLHVCDIRSARLATVVAGSRPDVVVHVAAQAAVARSVIDPVFDASVNLLGTLTLLDACRRAGAHRVVYTSTGGAAYGDTDVLPTPESHPTRAVSPYGVSKVTAERYLEVWAELAGGRTLSLRLANVYGPRQSPHGEAGVVAIFTHRLLGGEPCIINGDGEQTRDYVYVDDVAEAVARAVAHDEAVGVVNIATGTGTSVNELYRRLARLARVDCAPVHGPAKPGEQRRSVLDAARAKAVLGWTPSIALDEGLARTLAHCHRKGVKP
ncbi:MAG: NAD-dependent epimerase/dehydratase family protein [Candidatus Rokuibacteriota bacterium]